MFNWPFFFLLKQSSDPIPATRYTAIPWKWWTVANILTSPSVKILPGENILMTLWTRPTRPLDLSCEIWVIAPLQWNQLPIPLWYAQDFNTHPLSGTPTITEISTTWNRYSAELLDSSTKTIRNEYQDVWPIWFRALVGSPFNTDATSIYYLCYSRSSMASLTSVQILYS